MMTLKSSCLLMTILSFSALPCFAESAQSPIQDTATAEQYFKHELEFKTNPYGVRQVVDGKVKNVTIVDVRSAKSYKEGHVPGAINIPEEKYSTFEGNETEFPGLRKDGYNYVYCYSATCNLAQKAAKKFASLGYPVKEMVGGYHTYKEHNPVEK